MEETLENLDVFTQEKDEHVYIKINRTFNPICIVYSVILATFLGDLKSLIQSKWAD